MSDDRSPVDDMTRRELALAVDKQRQRIAELEAANQELRDSIDLSNRDHYEQSVRNREATERAEVAEKITRELSAENAGLRRQLYDANAELERLRAERWEPVEDSGEVFVVGGFYNTVKHRWWIEDEVLVMEHIPTGTQSRCRIPAGHAVCRKEARNE